MPPSLPTLLGSVGGNETSWFDIMIMIREYLALSIVSPFVSLVSPFVSPIVEFDGDAASGALF